MAYFFTAEKVPKTRRGFRLPRTPQTTRGSGPWTLGKMQNPTINMIILT
jgi:hypothetical protein